MELTKILIVEDSLPRRDYLTELVQILGFHAHPVLQKTEFMRDLNKQNPDLVLLGPCANPCQLRAFAKVVEVDKIPIIYIMDGAKSAILDEDLSTDNICCLPKTFNAEDLRFAIDRMIKEFGDSNYQQLSEFIIGKSRAVREIRKHILHLSKSDVTVLVTGESGTGKEMVAKAIHDFSPRAKKPFIKVNSAALPDNLIESELFGYEKGAFTGAWKSKPGKFLLAHSGTLFLDEIGEISLHLQPKLLQVLEDNELSALGSTTNAKIDVRILASTNSDLRHEVANGGFRADLFYRLNVISVHLPPLRDRTEDIAPLCNHFLTKHATLNGNDEKKISDRILEKMHSYSWPGNVRELENIIKSFAVLGNDEVLFDKLSNHHVAAYSPTAIDFPQSSTFNGMSFNNPTSTRCLKKVCKEAARRAETEAILDVLSHTRWNRRKTADLLKISYKALLNKIKEYEIEDKYRQLVRGQGSGVRGRRSEVRGQTTEDRGQGTAGNGQMAAESRRLAASGRN